MKCRHGFTLLELMMVVIIIGILASIALPQYLKTSERARMAEAVTMLGVLRAAEVRYSAQNNGNFTANVATPCDLDTCGTPAEMSGTPRYSYSAVVAPGTFDIRATRIGVPPAPCVLNYRVHIFQDGVISGSDCLSAL